MKPSVYIYALCEPGTRTIRYIGKSCNPYRRRTQHLRTAESMNTYLGRWLMRLKASGRSPDLIYLSVARDELADAEEKSQIARALSRGDRLTNATEGGDGVCNPSAETREKESRAKKRMYAEHPELKEEFRRRMTRHWAKPGTREARVKTMAANRTPESRQKFSAAMKAKNSQPAVRAKISAAVKARWADPEYRARRAAAFAAPGSYEKRCAAAKARSDKPDVKAASRRRHTKLWADPAFRAENTARIKAACSTPESHAKRCAAQKKRRAKHI